MELVNKVDFRFHVTSSKMFIDVRCYNFVKY